MLIPPPIEVVVWPASGLFC